MPTEDETRQLLAKAAATIAVGETTPTTLADLPEPGPRRWPVVAAAAAVLLAVGGGYLVARQLGDDPQPAPVVDRTDEQTVDEEVGLDDDQLPNLIGYTEEEAIALLQERGYPVEVRVVPDGCNVAEVVTGTTPAVGTRMVPGDPVEIRVVGQQDVIDCVGELPWDTIWAVVRSAQGLAVGQGPLDGVRFPRSARETVERMLTAEWQGEGSPRLLAEWTYVEDACPPVHVPGDDRLQVWIGSLESKTAGQCARESVLISFDERGRIAAVESDTVTEETLEQTLDRLSTARMFVEWARGEGAAPLFADRVRVMYGGGGASGSTGWVDSPEDRTRYAGCSGLGFPDCGLDPVALLVRHEGHVATTLGRSTCVDGGEVPERFEDAVEDVVRIESPRFVVCRHWAVELWVDEDGLIYGVNQAGG